MIPCPMLQVFFYLLSYQLMLYIFFFSGKIPLRQLVYRVLDLPRSMRPLVYDFGQLNKDTERDYIGQIVEDHVRIIAVVNLCSNIIYV